MTNQCDRWGIALLVTFAVLTPSLAQGQQGVQILDGLLQDLLQSKIERRSEPRHRRGEQEQAHPLLVPGTRSNRQVAPDRVPPVVLKASRFYGQFATESEQLIRLLRQDARKVPGISSHLDEVMQLQARSKLMSRRFGTPQKEDFILGNIQALDQDWRIASYRLRQLPGIANACQLSMTRLDKLNQQCCDLFDLEPQLDRRELVRLADSLAAEIHHLESDVEYELRSKPRARKLLMQLRRTEARAKLLSDSIADGDDMGIVVAAFQQFVAEWNPVARTLSNFQDRHIDRTTEQIHAINRALHEHLWLPVGVDTAHVKHLAIQTQKRITALGDTFSLSMLAELPDATSVIAAAQVLNRETQHLCEGVATDESQDGLVSHWTELDSAWRAFEQHTSNIDSPRIRTLRQEISGNVDAMRQALGVRLVFDRREVIRAVAELEAIAEQAQYHVAQWAGRPGANLDANLIRAANAMIEDIHHLHEEATGSASRQHLAKDSQQLVRDWAKLRPMLMRCRTVDQRTLRRISDDASTSLIRLQTLLSPS